VTRAAIAAFVVCLGLLVGLRVDAVADDAEQAFQTSLARGDIAQLEELGAARPLTRWSDDAWVEAARLSIRANDLLRARRDLEQAIAIAAELELRGLGDAQLARRARAELARLTSIGGATGEWDAVAAEHERLIPLLRAPGDPTPTLKALEALAKANPRYPRVAILMTSLGLAWELEGDEGRSIHWLRAAIAAATEPAERLRAHAELVRVLTRAGELSLAADELATLGKTGPPAVVASLRRDLERAAWRRTIRWAMRGVLAVLAALALVALRRAAGTWGAALRRLVRPPTEAIYIVPLAVMLIVIAATGNPLVARAVRSIALAGVVASWISGAILEGRERVRLRRALVHGALAIVAILAATYLAVDDGHLIDFLRDTWREGHETR
jgi:hypothetical protein